MLELCLRLVFSLAVVLGLLAVIARVGGRRFQGSREPPDPDLSSSAWSRSTSLRRRFSRLRSSAFLAWTSRRASAAARLVWSSAIASAYWCSTT